MTVWLEAKNYEDITCHKADGMALISLNRLEIRNVFRPQACDEMNESFRDAWMNNIGVVLLTANLPSPKDAKWALCTRGSQTPTVPWPAVTSAQSSWKIG